MTKQDSTNDIHDTPLTRGADRMHELSRACWCEPTWKARVGGPGCIVVHRGTTLRGAEANTISDFTI